MELAEFYQPVPDTAETSLFDFIADGNTQRGKYETNHFHIYCKDKVTIPLADMQEKTKGTFMHEYLHYIQHITTVYGLYVSNLYNQLFLECLRYCKEDEEISIPIHDKVFNDNKVLKERIDKHLSIAGKKDSDEEIEKIMVNQDEPKKAFEQGRAVRLDLTRKDGTTGTFDFGYYCVIETMAHLFQQYYDEDLNHPDIPYKAGLKVCEAIAPELLNDKRKLICILFCALMTENPGSGFFLAIEFYQQSAFNNLNGWELYKEFLANVLIDTENGEESITKALLDGLSDLESCMGMLIRHDLEYFNQVIAHCRQQVEWKDHMLISLLYSANVIEKEYLDGLFDMYGIPLIDGNGVTILPRNVEKKRVRRLPPLYFDTAALFGIELLFQRLIPTKDRKTKMYVHKCPRFEKCMDYDKGVLNMTRECTRNQWDKIEDCELVRVLDYWGLKDKMFTLSDY